MIHSQAARRLLSSGATLLVGIGIAFGGAEASQTDGIHLLQSVTQMKSANEADDKVPEPVTPPTQPPPKGSKPPTITQVPTAGQDAKSDSCLVPQSSAKRVEAQLNSRSVNPIVISRDRALNSAIAVPSETEPKGPSDGSAANSRSSCGHQ